MPGFSALFPGIGGPVLGKEALGLPFLPQLGRGLWTTGFADLIGEVRRHRQDESHDDTHENHRCENAYPVYLHDVFPRSRTRSLQRAMRQMRPFLASFPHDMSRPTSSSRV